MSINTDEFLTKTLEDTVPFRRERTRTYVAKLAHLTGTQMHVDYYQNLDRIIFRIDETEQHHHATNDCAFKIEKLT